MFLGIREADQPCSAQLRSPFEGEELPHATLRPLQRRARERLCSSELGSCPALLIGCEMLQPAGQGRKAASKKKKKKSFWEGVGGVQ